MNFLKKSLVGAAVAVACLASANAAVNNIGGVYWDPAVGSDFVGSSDSAFQSTDSSGLPTGYGLVTSINGLSNFCTGCELTYTFSGFSPAGAPGSLFGTTYIPLAGGTFTLYVDNSMDGTGAGNLNATTASNGTPWLVLSGHYVASLGYALLGSFNSSLLPSDDQNTLTGTGYLDVIGGLAALAFDTDSKLDGSDIAFGSSFTANNGSGPWVGLASDKSGSATFSGDSIAVPEPASLALVGLGLLGLAGARRRKSV